MRVHVQHLHSPVPSASIAFGLAIHEGVRVLYDGGSPAEAGERAAASWGGVGKGLAEASGEPEAVKPLAPAQVFAPRALEAMHAQKPYLSAEYAAKVVEMYAQEHPAESRGRVLLNEQYLEAPEQRICGVVDRVAMRNVGSEVVVVRDLKTTGLYVGEKWARQWAHNLQTGSFYLDLAERAVRRTVDTVWIDAVHVDRRGYPKPDDFHMFGPFRYSPQMRAELRAVRAALIARADYLVEHPSEALKEPRSCFRFNELCPLFNFCLTDAGDAREARYAMALASGELEERVWNPKER